MFSQSGPRKIKNDQIYWQSWQRKQANLHNWDTEINILGIFTPPKKDFLPMNESNTVIQHYLYIMLSLYCLVAIWCKGNKVLFKLNGFKLI